MISKTSIICFALCIVVASAALYRTAPSKSDCPGHPNHCYDKEVDAYYAVGSTTNRKGKCERAQCLEDFSMEFATCGFAALPENCKLSEEDLTKDYPDCCPKPICTKE